MMLKRLFHNPRKKKPFLGRDAHIASLLFSQNNNHNEYEEKDDLNGSVAAQFLLLGGDDDDDFDNDPLHDDEPENDTTKNGGEPRRNRKSLDMSQDDFIVSQTLFSFGNVCYGPFSVSPPAKTICGRKRVLVACLLFLSFGS